MRLLSCRIDGFGHFRDRTFEFTGGLNEFLRPNGTGKSTLIAFLTAMLCGLDDRSRERCAPAGGSFGGTLTLKKDGREYIVHRTFDRKNKKNDTLSVFCDRVPVEAAAETLTGLDADAFRRVLVIDAYGLELSAGDSLREKLGGGEGSDGVSTKKAMEALEHARKALDPDRHTDKKPGLIRAKEKEIREIYERLEEKERLKDELARQNREAAALKKELEENEERLRQVRQREENKKRREFFASELERKNEAEARVKALCEAYPFGFPTAEETEDARKAAEEIRALVARAEAQTFDRTGEYERLHERFPSGLPDETTVAACRKAREEAKDAAKRCASLGETEEIPPSASGTGKIKEMADELENARQSQKGTIAMRLLLLAAAASAVAGAWLIGSGKNLALGCFALAFVLTVSALLVRAIAKNTVKKREDALLGALADLGAETKASAAESAKSYLAACAEKERTRREKLEKNAKRDLARGEAIEAKDAYDRALAACAYHAPEEDDAFRAMEADLAALREMEKTRDGLRARRAEALAKADELTAQWQAFASRYLGGTLSPEKLTELQRDAAEFMQKKKEKESLEKDLERLDVDKPEETGEMDDPTLFEREIERERSLLAHMEDQVRAAELRLEELEDETTRLERAGQEKDELKKRYELILRTERALTEAEQSLTEKTLGPLRRRFEAYLGPLEETLGRSVYLTNDYSLSVLFDGVPHPGEHLSAGERTLCAFCLRLALADTLLEEPFFLLDDPFTALDEEHTEKMKQLLSALADRKQFLYLCCHESRRMGGKS